MRGSFRLLRQDKIIFWGILLTIIITFSGLVFILVSLKNLPPYIPLFNQLPWGVERLSSSVMIFLPIIIILVFSTVNIFISSFIYAKSQIISRMLTITNVLISFLSFLFIVRTIQLIT